MQANTLTTATATASRATAVALFLLLAIGATAHAKLPALAGDAKAKADEAAAKTGYGDKTAAYQLCKAQDRIAGQYIAAVKAAGNDIAPTPTPACTDPGPFVYAPSGAGAGTLEASAAHSPAQTAATPPSANTTKSGPSK